MLPFPLPGKVAQIFPLCIFTNCFAIYSLRPAPSVHMRVLVFPHEKLPKRCWSSSLLILPPVSFIVMITLLVANLRSAG